MNVVRITTLAGAVALAVAFAGVGVPDGARGGPAAVTSKRTVTVTGSGSVSAVPDRATFSFGVTTQGKTASQALSANAAEMRKVIAALRGEAIAAADIQTQVVSLSPRYSQDGEAIVGYTASNTVSTTLRDLGRAGAVIDAAVGAGANQVFGPALTRSDQGALYRSALRAAVANARAKAQAIAAAGGLRLGAVQSVVESSAGPPPVPFGAAKAVAEQTPIEPGTQVIEAGVTVEFAAA